MACGFSVPGDCGPIITECMVQGDSLLIRFDMIEGPDETTGVPKSLAGYTFRATFRDESDAVALALTSMTATPGGSVILLEPNTVTGRVEIRVSITDSSASAWRIEELTFDVEMEWIESGRTWRETILNGSKLTVIQGRTR